MKKTVLITLISLWIPFNLTVLSSCKKTVNGTPGENEIFLLYKTFSPTSLSVKKGTTVTFTNKDNANHTVTSNSRLFDSGKIKSGTSYSYTFSEAGTYYFYCNYHSTNQQEQGAIIVQ
jgi:hypothetical protein